LHRAGAGSGGRQTPLDALTGDPAARAGPAALPSFARTRPQIDSLQRPTAVHGCRALVCPAHDGFARHPRNWARRGTGYGGASRAGNLRLPCPGAAAAGRAWGSSPSASETVVCACLGANVQRGPRNGGGADGWCPKQALLASSLWLREGMALGVFDVCLAAGSLGPTTAGSPGNCRTPGAKQPLLPSPGCRRRRPSRSLRHRRARMRLRVRGRCVSRRTPAGRRYTPQTLPSRNIP
jgi:hypothetical protein